MDIYDRQKKTSMCWFNKSSDLRASAAAIWVSTDPELSDRIVKDCSLGGGFVMGAAVIPVFRMLCGMSMELIFKAIVVKREDKVNESDHNLLNHASMAGIIYSEHERQLLKILTHSIVWAGRYPTPTPKKRGHMQEYSELVSAKLFDQVPLGTMSISIPNHSLDWESFNEMWSKAMSHYFREDKEA